MNYKYLFLSLMCMNAGTINSFSLFTQPKKLNRTQRKMVKYFRNKLEQENEKCMGLFSAFKTFDNEEYLIEEAIIYAQEQSFIAGIGFPVYYTCNKLEQTKQYFNSKLKKHTYLPNELQHDIRTFIKNVERIQQQIETSRPFRIDRKNHSFMRSLSRWIYTVPIFVTLI